MGLLIEFLFRLAFGLALAMVVTPTRWVSSGYYRVNSYVLLGLCVLAALAAASSGQTWPLWAGAAAAVCSYASSAAFLYEKPTVGVPCLGLIAAGALVGAWTTTGPGGAAGGSWLHWVDPVAGGLVLGSTMAAMLLGHWYLNSPTMRLDPLRRLVLLIAACLALRALASGAGLIGQWSLAPPVGSHLAFVALRWLAGIVGTLVAAVMAWQTLKIPNTQSATGILYVAVITTFLGELTSQLLSVESRFPL